ncbi:hypothetical protein QTP88_001191 [Uroleucon formosanum]
MILKVSFRATDTFLACLDWFHTGHAYSPVEKHRAIPVVRMYRLNKIKEANSTVEILEEWKNYSIPLGYKLVDIDFHGLYHSTTIPDLCEEFIKSYDSILQIVEQYIKDKDVFLI